MRNACFIFLLFSSFYTAQTQHTFIVDAIQRPQAEAIFDVAFYDNQFYCLSINTALTTPFEKTSTLFIIKDDGSLASEHSLGDIGHQYFQIYAVEPGHVQLIGSQTATPCSHVVLADFDITTGAMKTLAQYEFCDGRVINKLRLVNGLDNTFFVQGSHGPYFWHNTSFVFELEDQTGFTLVFDSISNYEHITVDFSKKGYALKGTYTCEFYDLNWNFRKQRNNFLQGYDDAENTAHLPFGNKQILDQVIKDGPYAQALRMVDSNLFIRDEAIIVPPGNGGAQINYLPINGLSQIDEQHVWVAANYGDYTESDFSFYGIARLDADLNILCNQFLGFDANYQLNGIRTHPDGSAIIFGQRLPFNEEAVSAGADIFVAKFDPDCDLSTSITDPNDDAIKITAVPNPGFDQIRFASKDIDVIALQVHMVDANGKVVLSKQGANELVNVSKLAAGQYFYYVFDDKKLIDSGGWTKQ